MEVEWKALADYVELLRPWIGDKRTARTVRGTIEGILASQTLRCTQIAAFSPMFAGSESAYKRVRRLVHGETRKRSELSEGRIREGLQAVAVERLAGAEEVWVALDTTDLRKPHATAMEALMEVRDLEKRPVPGYRVLNALGRTPEARGSPLPPSLQ